MTLIYSHTIKAFTAAILVCGAIYLMGYRQLAGYMLLGTGCMGMVITVGSAAGWVDVIRDGRVITPAAVSPCRVEELIGSDGATVI
jgi:hypothetical protein